MVEFIVAATRADVSAARGFGTAKLKVELEGVDIDELFGAVGLDELLDAIGQDAVVKYFGLTLAEE